MKQEQRGYIVHHQTNPRIAYTINGHNPVLCSYISTEPLYYDSIDTNTDTDTDTDTKKDTTT